MRCTSYSRTYRANALYLVLENVDAARVLGSSKLSSAFTRVDRRCHQLVERVLQRVVEHEAYLYGRVRGHTLARWAKGPRADPGRPPGARHAVVGEDLQQMLWRFQEESHDRAAACAVIQPDIQQAVGPFGLCMTPDGVISVLSNRELMELAKCEGIRAQVKGSATAALINMLLLMHFPVNKNAEQGQGGGGLCPTMVACKKAFQGPMRVAWRHNLCHNPSLQMLVVAVGDMLPCAFPPKIGKNPKRLERYHPSTALSCPLSVLDL